MNMKKTLLTLLLVCSTFAANAMRTAEIPEKIDTLSYITGQQIGHAIEDQIIPQLRLDYNTIFATIDANFAKHNAITVEGVTITPENIQELGLKYLSQECQQRVLKAMNDSTIEIFNATDTRVVSALMGADFAYRLKDAPYPVEKSSVMLGIEDTHNKQEKLTLEQANNFINHYFTVVIPQQKKKESDAWLADVEKMEGVVKTESGLLYKIEVAGDMNVKAVKDEDVVKVLYTGCTKSGKVFDTNRWNFMPEARQEMVKSHNPELVGKDSPIEFPLDKVIKGWTEGMKLVGKGGRISLWIPAELAYGERGAGQDIGPNEALYFDVELLDVTNK